MKAHLLLSLLVASAVLTACGKAETPAEPQTAVTAEPAASSPADAAAQAAPRQEVRAPAPPPPPGGGKPAPEIDPVTLAKIRAELEKNAAK